MKKHTKVVRFIRTKYAYVDINVLKPETEFVPLTLDQKFQKELKRFKSLSAKDKKELERLWDSFSEKQRKVALSKMRLL